MSSTDLETLQAFIAAVYLPLALYAGGGLLGALLGVIIITGAYNALHRE